MTTASAPGDRKGRPYGGTAVRLNKYPPWGLPRRGLREYTERMTLMRSSP